MTYMLLSGASKRCIQLAGERAKLAAKQDESV
eukprot:COSAG05_NODE_21670_length_270_cov_0.608187_2_plen_32_part_01